MSRSRRTLALLFSALAIAAGAWAAGEITANFSLEVKKGSLNVSRSANQTLDLQAANPNVSGFTQLIPTNYAGTGIDLGSVVTNGVAWFRNLSTRTNYIDIGVSSNSTFLPLLRLMPGEAWPFRVAPGASPYARPDLDDSATNSRAVVLESIIVDN